MVKMLNEEDKKELEWYRKRYVYVKKRGLKNWRNLFKRPNGYEWTILFMLVMGLYMGYSYLGDVSACHETLENLPQIACEYCNEILNQENPPQNIQNITTPNFSLFLKEDNEPKS